MKTLYEAWTEQIYDKGTEVDPSNEYCWKSLAVGFALGWGTSIPEAEAFYLRLLKENHV